MPSGSSIFVYGGLSSAKVDNIGIFDLIFQAKTVTGFWLTEYMKRFSIPELMSMFILIQEELQTSFSTETTVFEKEDWAKAIEHAQNNASHSKAILRFSD